MAPVDHKTMFEIYRETDYNRAFRYVFFTDLDEHNRGKEIARAAAGETVFSGFIADERKLDARAEVELVHAQMSQVLQATAQLAELVQNLMTQQSATTEAFANGTLRL